MFNNVFNLINMKKFTSPPLLTTIHIKWGEAENEGGSNSLSSAFWHWPPTGNPLARLKLNIRPKNLDLARFLANLHYLLKFLRIFKLSASRVSQPAVGRNKRSWLVETVQLAGMSSALGNFLVILASNIEL